VIVLQKVAVNLVSLVLLKLHGDLLKFATVPIEVEAVEH
jgi:hypothetical protein